MIAVKYGEDRNGWCNREPVGSMGCGVWKGVYKGVGSLSRLIRFKVNNGKRVLFWHDLWCSNEPLSLSLSLLFPSCYNVAGCKWGTMEDHMIQTRVLCL